MRYKNETIVVLGMTCVNCARRIEQELLNTNGVKSVEISFGSKQAKLEYDESVVAISEIKDIIRHLGYEAASGNVNKRGKVCERFLYLLVIIIAYVLLRQWNLLNYLVPAKVADSTMSYAMLFFVGLLTSVHCVAMCGGINLSQCIPLKKTLEKGALDKEIFKKSALVNLGRVISYSMIGFVLGGVGMMISTGAGIEFSTTLQGSIKLFAGTLMVIMGTNMLGIFHGFVKKRSSFITSFFNKINRKKRFERRPFIVGLLNGLMPCGPLQSMQIIAFGTGNPISGALSMFMFSLGTVPLMLGLGVVVSVIGKKYTAGVMKAGSILVVVMGLAMFAQGMNLTGLSGSLSSVTTVHEDGNIAIINPDENIQYVESVLDYGGYPEITVYSNIPVAWTIYAPQEVINGCNYQMILNQYGITYTFSPGENVICFTPGETGTVQYTCWMGMLSGRINIIDYEVD